jgi:CheY-like chemotaxis protein
VSPVSAVAVEEPAPAIKPVVLVVDDDPDIRDAVGEVLTELGYVVELASDGATGLQKLRQLQGPCVVLLDMMMPVMDGATFLLELERDELYAGTPVIAMSASPVKAQVAVVLRKPFELDELLSAVARFCA